MTDYLIKAYGLTAHQAKIAAFIIEGLSNKDIALKLGRTEKSIRSVNTEIYRKCGVTAGQGIPVREQLIVKVHNDFITR